MAQVRKRKPQPGVLCIGETPGELRQPTHIQGLAVSGDGRHVATTDDRGLVRLFDTAAGTREERKPPFKVNNLFEPTNVVLSESGTTVAVHYKYANKTWILPTATFGTAAGTVVANNFSDGLAVSPDGATVACPTLWALTLTDAATGRQRQIALGDDTGPLSLGFAPGTDLLAVLFRDHRLRLVDTATGALQAESEELGPDNLFSSVVAVRPDGTVLVALAQEPGLLEWDGRSPTVRRRPVEVPDLVPQRWQPRLLPPLGLLAVRLTGDRLALLDLDSGQVRRELPLADRAIAASADGRTIAVSSGVVVDLYDGASLERRSVEPELATVVDAVAFEPGGGALWTADRTSARRWTVPDGKLDRTVDLHGGGDHRLSRDARTLLHFHWRAADRTNELIRLPSGERREFAGAVGRLPSVSADGGLVCGFSKPAPHGPLLWDTATGRPLDPFDGAATHASAFSPAGDRLATGGRDAISVYDVTDGSVVARVRSPGRPPWSLDLSADGNLLAFGSDARPVHVVSLPSGQVRHVLMGHTRRLIGALAFAPDSTLLASSSGHETRLWNAVTGEAVAVIRVGAESLAFSPDGRYLAAGGNGRAWLIDVTPIWP